MGLHGTPWNSKDFEDSAGLHGTPRDFLRLQDSVESLESAISPLIKPELRVRVELNLIEFEQFGFGACLTSNDPEVMK